LAYSKIGLGRLSNRTSVMVMVMGKKFGCDKISPRLENGTAHRRHCGEGHATFGTSWLIHPSPCILAVLYNAYIVECNTIVVFAVQKPLVRTASMSPVDVLSLWLGALGESCQLSPKKKVVCFSCYQASQNHVASSPACRALPRCYHAARHGHCTH